MNARRLLLPVSFVALVALSAGCSQSSHHPGVLGDCVGALCPPVGNYGSSAAASSGEAGLLDGGEGGVGDGAAAGEGGAALEGGAGEGGALDAGGGGIVEAGGGG